MPALSNQVHESFARLITIGTPVLEAYTQAMIWNQKRPLRNVRSATQTGFRWLQDSAVTARVEEFKREIQIRADEEFAIDLRKAVKILVDTLNSRPDEASMDNPLCEIVYVGKFGTPSPIFPSKAKYMEILARIMGWNSETINLKGDVHIEFTVHDRREDADGPKKLAHATTIDV